MFLLFILVSPNNVNIYSVIDSMLKTYLRSDSLKKPLFVSGGALHVWEELTPTPPLIISILFDF